MDPWVALHPRQQSIYPRLILDALAQEGALAVVKHYPWIVQFAVKSDGL